MLQIVMPFAKKIFLTIHAFIIIFLFMHNSDAEFRSMSDRVETLKVIAHPVRIRILRELLAGVKCVSDFEEFLDISQPNVSQHLALMRRYGLIDFFIDGRLKCYFLVDPIIPDLLDLIQREYKEKLPAPACCPVTKKGKYPGTRIQKNT